ncbi:MAG: EamA family transporter [Actinomycetota bacterium]|nr:EamA family transporter [Actinomycetota bacterium]
MLSAVRTSQAALGLVAIAVAATLFALAGAVASNLFDAGVTPVELAQVRAAVAFFGLLLVPAARRGRGRRLEPRLVLLHGTSLALVTVSYYIALDHLAVAVAIVFQYTGPAMVVAWTATRARRRPSARILLCLVMAVAGAALISEIASGRLGSLNLVGVGAGLASAVLFASMSILSEMSADVFGPLGATLRAWGVAVGLWALYGLAIGRPERALDLELLPQVLFVSLLGTLVPFFLYVWGIERVRAERASIALTLEPVVAAAVAWVWLGQSLSAIQVAGGALVIAAVVALPRRTAPAYSNR